MSFPNPWDQPAFYQTVIIGGRPVKAALVEIDGIKIEDEWAEQKPTGHSGATNVFKGTKPAGPGKLTFEACDAADFDDLRELYELLAPKAGSGANSNGNTVGSNGSAAYGKGYVLLSTNTNPAPTATPAGLLAQAQAALAAVQSGANTAAAQAGGAAASTPAKAAAQPSPGPKPPTLSIVNGYLNYVGITAISRKSWDGPKPTATNSYRVVLEVVMQKDPAPAAVGASAPKSADNPGQKTIAFGDIQDPASSARDANTAAAQAGAM